jgi:uncharacterized membrane protein
MSYTTFMDYVTRAFELVGVAVLVVGFVVGFIRALVARLRQGTSEGVYVMIRSYFGRSILLGLEVLVAADLIRTVAVDPTMQNVLTLGLIVLIRTFLSFSLEIEIDGVVPWRRWRLSAPDAPPPAQRSEEAPRG